MKVYIAGPMTGREFYNYDAFYKAGLDWVVAGHDVVTPFDTNSIVWAKHYGRGFDPHTDKCDYGDPILGEMLVEDMKALTEADAIVLLDGWRQSKGASAELLVALNLKKEVYAAETMERLLLKPSLTFEVAA